MLKKRLTIFIAFLLIMMQMLLLLPQISMAAVDTNKVPAQVTIAVTQTPSTSVAFNWTTVDTTMDATNVVQVMDKSLSAGFDAAKSTEFSAVATAANVVNSATSGITQKLFDRANVTGLTPNTSYLYRVGNRTDDTWSSVGSFKTAPSDNSGFTFTYMADPQISNTTNSKAAMATFEEVCRDYPDSAFTYIAGDFTDTGNNEGQWESFFNGGGTSPNGGMDLFANHITVGTEGNHETSSDSSAATFGRHFGFPTGASGLRNVYSFDYGMAHFMVLNTNYNADNTDLQNEMIWLANDANASSKRWKIVMLHKPLYSGAEHIADADMTIFRSRLGPLFNQLHIDAVLGGHDHVFSRGFVTSAGANANPTVISGDVTSNNATVIEPNAPFYMVNNTAGGLKWYNKVNYTPAASDPVTANYAFLDRDSATGFTQADTIQEQTFTNITVSNDSLIFNTKMFKYDTTGDTITDPLHDYDSFTIKKQDTVTPPADKTFDLVEITDFHGQLMNSTNTLYVGAALSKSVKDIVYGNPNRTLILGGGDLYQGTPVSNVLRGVPVKDVFSDMGMEVTALGNHEFDWGLDTVINQTMQGAKYQILCTNVYKKGTTERVFSPYKVITKDGLKIAVIGAITNDTPNIIMPAYAANYDFKDVAAEINTVAQGIKNNHEADVIIAVIHEGSDALNQIVSKLHGINAVFGGHSHTILDTVLKDADNNNVPTLNAQNAGKGYIDLKMTVKASDSSISFSSTNNFKSLTVVSSTPLDTNAKAITDAALNAIGPTFNEVIGHTTEDMTSDQSAQPYGESELGNWMSDVVKNYANADVGMVNNGGIRLSPIPAGDITVGEVFSIMPFDNTICTTTMSGAQLKILLEQVVADTTGKGVQVSGIKFTYDPTKTSYSATTAGQRITSMTRESNNTVINAADVLKVAAPDFVATGGDNFYEFTDSAIKASLVDSHYLVRDAMIADVRAKVTIPKVMNSRIVKAASTGTPTEMTIAQARTVASGSAILTGTVSIINGSDVFIQDSTAGICLYNSKHAVVQKGDRVKVTGVLSLYNALLEITPGAASDVQVLSSGNTVTPKIVTVNQIDQSIEGQLIQLKGVTLTSIDTTNLSMLQDATGSVGIYKMPALTGIEVGDKVDVTAAVGHYNTTFELWVGSASDVVKAGNSGTPTSPAEAKITILATSDIHGNIFNYDYALGAAPSKGQGLAKVSTFVKGVRAANPNVMLIDNGDTIQGTPLSYYYDMIDKTSEYPMMKVMGAMGYDAWTLGNHEFNYGLDTLNRIIGDAVNEHINILSANTYKADNTNFVRPYITKSFTVNGKVIKVGILGLTTKTIPSWEDVAHYAGLHFNDLVDEARKWVPIMRGDTEKCDIVIISAHSGEESVSDVIPENQVKAIAAGVSGIDAIVAGHVHNVVNDLSLKNPDGKVVPVVEPGKFGNDVSQIDINVDAAGAITGISTQNVPMDNTYAEDAAITTLAKPYQDQTLIYIQTVLGTAGDEFTGSGQYVVPTAIMDLVNKVQKDAALSQLSIAAPLSASAYIPKGNVTIKDIMSVYVYENFLYGVKMTGKQIKDWMEYSVRYYKQINDPALVIDSTTVYTTLKDSTLNIADYNLDQLYGATYDIDLTQPACTIDPVTGRVASGNRIKNLKINGVPVKDAEQFTVAINNYRYNGGGGFMKAVGLSSTDPGIVTYDSAKKLGDDGQVRSLMMSYIKKNGNINPTCSNNWKLNAAPVTQQLNVSVETAAAYPGKDVDVKVTMKDLIKVSGLKVKLSFDPVKLTVKNVVFDAQLSNNAVNKSVPGELLFNAINEDGITAAMLDIATITFTVNSGIVTDCLPISIVSAEACDNNSKNIVLTKNDGSISVAPSVPTVSNVTFTGEAVVGKLLTAKYDYNDPQGRDEAGTSFRWLIADQAAGSYTAIPGATNRTFTVTKDYIGKYIKIEVTPKNAQTSGAAVTGDNGRNVVIALGDVYKDGSVNYIDALSVIQFIDGKKVIDLQAQSAADVNNDQKVDMVDIITILEVDIGLYSLNR